MIGTCSFTATGEKALLSPTIGAHWAVLASGTVSSGSIAATIELYGSNTPGDANSWVLIDTLSLAGTSPQKDTYVGVVGWGHAKAKVTALTGTDASVTVSLCSQ